MAFVLCVREGIYGFQCLLRSGPAVATVAPQYRIDCRLPQDHRPQALKPDDPKKGHPLVHPVER